MKKNRSQFPKCCKKCKYNRGIFGDGTNCMGCEKIKKYFVCEICKEKTPIECEGREPNTCAMCMPILFDDIDSKFID